MKTPARALTIVSGIILVISVLQIVPGLFWTVNGILAFNETTLSGFALLWGIILFAQSVWGIIMYIAAYKAIKSGYTKGVFILGAITVVIAAFFLIGIRIIESILFFIFSCIYVYCAKLLRDEEIRDKYEVR